MHSHMIEQVPSFCELFVAFIILADIQDLESRLNGVPDLNFFMLKWLQELFIDFFF